MGKFKWFFVVVAIALVTIGVAGVTWAQSIYSPQLPHRTSV
jgi:hypothetical protein